MSSAQERFVSNVYRRIQLAAAICVIKNSPKERTPEEHAIHIQQCLNTQWFSTAFSGSSSEPQFSVDHHILNQQQNALSTRLLSLISQPSNYYLDVSTVDLANKESYNDSAIQNECELRTEQPCFDTLTGNNLKLEANANFIHAIIQLKALAELKSTIPMQKYVSSVSRLLDRKNTITSSFAEVSCPLQSEPLLSSEDSGFQTPDDFSFGSLKKSGREHTAVTGVASSMLLHLIRSFNSDQLLLKSIQAILHQIRGIAQLNDTLKTVFNLDDIVNQWKGSLYQQALSVLQPVISVYGQPEIQKNSSCYELCLSLIQDIILEIMEEVSSNTQTSYASKENQILLVLQISEGTSLGVSALQLIVNKIKELSRFPRRKRKEARAPESRNRRFCRSSDTKCFRLLEFKKMEQSYFLFLLARHLLESANRYQVSIINEEEPVQNLDELLPATNTIADLWRKHYSAQITYHSELRMEDEKERERFDVKSWRQVLEDSFGKFMTEYPLISVLIAESVDLIPSFSH